MQRPLPRPAVFYGDDPDYTFEFASAELASDIREYSAGEFEFDAGERNRLVISLPAVADVPAAQPLPPLPDPPKKRSKTAKNASKTA